MNNLRSEVQDLIRACEHLIGFAHQTNGKLTRDACDLIMYYAKELEKEIAPYCTSPCEAKPVA